MTRPTTYPPLARTLHWTIAICVLAAIPLGIAMGQVPSGPTQNTLFDLHRSFGFLILVLAVIRWANRLAGGTPRAFPVEPAWKRVAAHAVHELLYVLLLVMPILGWVGTSAYGATIRVFWLFDLPALVAKNEALAEQLLPLHATLGLVMGGLVVIHIAAALHHQFVLRDPVLTRMWRGA